MRTRTRTRSTTDRTNRSGTAGAAGSILSRIAKKFICKPPRFSKYTHLLLKPTTSLYLAKTNRNGRKLAVNRHRFELKKTKKLNKHLRKSAIIYDNEYEKATKNIFIECPKKQQVDKRQLVQTIDKVTGCVDRKTNEPPNKVERSRTKIAEETSSRKSGRLGRSETSKNSRDTIQASRQPDKPKQSRSCRRKEGVGQIRYASKSHEKQRQEKEKGRRYTSNLDKLKSRQKSLNSKDVNKTHRQHKVNIQEKRAGEHIDDTHNCSIYQIIDTRTGYNPLSTCNIDKYLCCRTLKYLSPVQNSYILKGLASKTDEPTLEI